MRSLRYEACRKFGEHKRCVRVARGVAERNSSFLSLMMFADIMSVHNKNMKHARFSYNVS